MKKEKAKFSYDTLWKFIIRPSRDNYSEELLGQPTFLYRGRTYFRRDYDLLSSEGYTMKCSFIEPEEMSRPKEDMPVVIYLHGNSSSRLEGLRIANELLKRDINLFILDFPGCGLSGGDYISLGYHERDDIGIVIDFLEKIPGVGNIGIWGRSMGAASTLLYSYKDPRVKAICVDSPFADFKRLAKELTQNYVNLPSFLFETIISFVGNTIIKKNGLDISQLKPIECVSKALQPVLFIHAKEDKLINVQHSVDLYKAYKGPKVIKYIDKGGHNTKRPDKLKKEIGEFFHKYLILESDGSEQEQEQQGEKNSLFFEEKDYFDKEDNKNNNNMSFNHTNSLPKNIITIAEEHCRTLDQKDMAEIEQVRTCLLGINPNDLKEEMKKDKPTIIVDKINNV